MRIAVLSANLNSFDQVVESVPQETDHEVTFHRFTDENFPPITGLTPRLQYRIPKMFGWQMFSGYDYYIWLDGSVSMQHPKSVKWFMDQIGFSDIALFKHPWRNTIKEEVDHIEDHLKKGKRYITSRYKNGLHKEQLADIQLDLDYKDELLYTSTAFIYRDSVHVRDVLRLWWLHQSRYFTCDQVALPYVVKDSDISVIEENQYDIPYLTLTSSHK